MVLSTKNTKIGWIGTGVMGQSMANHLINAGYKLFVNNRTKIKSQNLINSGAVWLDTPQKIAEKTDVIFTIVGMPEDVEEVYFGEKGLFQKHYPEKIFIDMTTTKPSISIKINKKAVENGSDSLDAPVSGGDVGAKNKTLLIMVGGEYKTYNLIFPLFELMGKTIIYEGEAGSGQHTKLCNQIVIAGTMIGVCESLLYGKKAGLDLNVLINSISKGAAGCWTLDNLAPRIINKNYEPGFFVDHFIKDLGIALEEAKRMNLSLPGLALANQLYLAVKANGFGLKGTQALILALEKLSGI